MIVNERNLRIDGSLFPSSNKALSLKPAILLSIIFLKTIGMFQAVQVLVSQKYPEKGYLKVSTKKSLLERQHDCFPGRYKSLWALVT